MKQTNISLLWTSFMDIPWGRGSWLSFTSSCLLAPRREIPHALKLIAIARATMKGSNSTPSFETPLQRGVCSPQLVEINSEWATLHTVTKVFFTRKFLLSFYCLYKFGVTLVQLSTVTNIKLNSTYIYKNNDNSCQSGNKYDWVILFESPFD